MADHRSSPQGGGPDLEGIELVHALPGRIRLRVPGIKGRPDLAREIQAHLAGFKVIRRVESSPVTGSVLVFYDPEDTGAMLELGRMIIPGFDLDGPAAAGGRGLDAIPAPGGAGGPPFSEGVAAYFQQLNSQVGTATGGADLKVLLPASLFLCGILGLLAGKRIASPTWYDYLWFAFGTFFTLNRPAPAAAAGAGIPATSDAVLANGAPH